MGTSRCVAASLHTVMEKKRKHKRRDVPGHIRGESNLIGQETESGGNMNISARQSPQAFEINILFYIIYKAF